MGTFTKLLQLSAILFSITFTGCIPYSNMRFMSHDGESSNNAKKVDSSFVYLLQPNDLLSIKISSTNDNENELLTGIMTGNSGSGAATEASVYANGYLISPDGSIIVPYIGKIFLVGLTVNQAQDSVTRVIGEYLNNTSVKLRLMSYRVTFLGEFQKPGMQVFYHPKVNIYQAIALAGDLTDYANRKKIILLRRDYEKKTIERIEFDMRRKDIFDQNYFAVMPNDILYAEPIKNKIFKTNASNISLIVSTISFSLVLISLTSLAK